MENKENRGACDAQPSSAGGTHTENKTRGGTVGKLGKFLGPALPAGLVLVILMLTVYGTWSFGLWEPWESRTPVIADSYGGGGEVPEGISPLVDTGRARAGLPYLLVQLSQSLFGVGELQVRLPFLFFGLLQLLAAWWVGRRLISKRGALITVVVMASTPLYLLLTRQGFFESIAIAGHGLFMLGVLDLLWHRAPRAGGGETPSEAGGTGGTTGEASPAPKPVNPLLMGGWLAGSLVLSLWGGGAWYVAVLALVLWGLTIAVKIAPETFIPLRPNQSPSPGPSPSLVLLIMAIALTGISLLAGILGTGHGLGFNNTLFTAHLQGPARLETLEFFVRQLGFGFFPWVVFIPFALGRLLHGEDSRGGGDLGGSRGADPAPLVLLWFVITLIASGVGLAVNRHYLFPGMVPLVLLAGSYLDHMVGESKKWALVHHFLIGALVAAMGALLLRDVIMNPQILVEGVAFDGDLVRPPGFRLSFSLMVAGGVWIGLAGLFMLAVGTGAAGSSHLAGSSWAPATSPDSAPEAALAGGKTNVFRKWGRSIGHLFCKGRTFVVRGWAKYGKRSLLLPLLLLAGLGGGLIFAHGYVPALSHHLSGKGVLDVWEEATDGGKGRLPGYLLSLPPEAWFRDRIYNLDSSAELVDHLANGEGREFALVKSAQLAQINYYYQEKTGEHLKVLYDQSSQFMLVSNRLDKGKKDLNPITENVFTSLPDHISHPMSVDLENRLEIVGVDVPRQVKAGGMLEITTYYRPKRRITENWKVFLHVEKGPTRLNTGATDHYPVGGALPTNYWVPGTIIRDKTRVRVPKMTSTGQYRVYSGLYIGNRRMKVTADADHDTSNRVLLGVVSIY